MLNITARVIECKEILPGYRLLQMDAPQIARTARPGQFLHIKCSDTQDPLLRRPVSIHLVEKNKGVTGILYRESGRGTARLAAFTHLDIMGPLGSGFRLPGPGAKALVVGGGIGIAPLYFLLQELSAAGLKVDVILGAASVSHLLRVQEIRTLGHQVQLATGDGSKGHHGLVTDLCTGPVMAGIDNVFACGPHPMLRALAQITKRYQIHAQFSLEERMGCGIGACLACACKTHAGNPEGYKYSHVCTDGPVFSASEVVWE